MTGKARRREPLTLRRSADTGQACRELFLNQNEDVRDIAVGSLCKQVQAISQISPVSFLPPSLLPLFALVLSFHFLSISVDTRQACREVNHISRHGAGMSRGESADTGQACRGVSDRQGEATRAANAPSIRRHGAGMSRIIFEPK